MVTKGIYDSAKLSDDLLRHDAGLIDLVFWNRKEDTSALTFKGVTIVFIINFLIFYFVSEADFRVEKKLKNKKIGLTQG